MDGVYQHQLVPAFAYEYVTQANPISGTQYEVLAETRNVKIYGMTARVDWTIQPNLELHCIIDGVTYTADIAAPVTATNYYFQFRHWAENNNHVLTATPPANVGNDVYGRLVRLLMETTGGTTSQIRGTIYYGAF